jgi:hypothetical protein
MISVLSIRIQRVAAEEAVSIITDKGGPQRLTAAAYFIQVKVPTLFFLGEKDRRVPLAQGLQVCLITRLSSLWCNRRV